MGYSIPSPQLPSLQELLKHTCPPPAIILTAEWGGPGCHFSGIERSLPDTKVYKKQDSYHAARASELPRSSARVTFQMVPPVWCSFHPSSVSEQPEHSPES